MPSPTLDDLARRASGLVRADERVLLGICGSPGAGKSTLARALVDRLAAQGVAAVQVPMDGFHLADVVLGEAGLLDVKGSAATFDAYGYLALLHRLRSHDHVVYAPGFDRTLEQPLAAAIAVRPEHQVVVTEGNYLLDAEAPWPDVRRALDEVWFVELDDDLRRERLVERHVTFGKTREEAQAWVDRVDEPNAVRVQTQAHTADLVVGE
jgi:pantothenate kinase